MSDKITEIPLRSLNDNRPLPIIVSLKWNFPLSYVETQTGLLYSIHDWIKGITETKDVSDTWYRAQKQLSISIRELPYMASDSKTYQAPYTNDEGLYKIAAYLRVTKGRGDALRRVKDYLAKAGVFTDEMRRSSTALEARAKRYDLEGRSESWRDNRIEGVIERHALTAAIKQVVLNADGSVYRDTTETIYNYLWERTTTQLRQALEAPPKAELRDYFGEYALIYTKITEKLCADRLRNKQQVTIIEAMELVREIASVIHGQARQTSELLQKDLVTDKPLLPKGNKLA